MQTFPISADIHTHCIASGHGTQDTITDMARTAAERSLPVLGLSDHGPATPGAADSSYFRNLLLAERKRFGVSLFYGAELNILNEKGDVDLDDSLIQTLDYAFVSIHPPTFHAGTVDSNTGTRPQSGTAASNTDAYIRAMRHPGVRFLGHPDDGRFPADSFPLQKNAAPGPAFQRQPRKKAYRRYEVYHAASYRMRFPAGAYYQL